jgi:hypothetical protein
VVLWFADRGTQSASTVRSTFAPGLVSLLNLLVGHRILNANFPIELVSTLDFDLCLLWSTWSMARDDLFDSSRSFVRFLLKRTFELSLRLMGPQTYGSGPARLARPRSRSSRATDLSALAQNFETARAGKSS